MTVLRLVTIQDKAVRVRPRRSTAMPRRCTVCLHVNRTEVDKELACDQPFRSIADRFGLSQSALKRHKKNHLPGRLARAYEAKNADALDEVTRFQREQEAKDTREAFDIIQQLRAVNAATLEVVKKARAGGQDSTLLRAVDRIHRQIEIQARLLGEIQEAQTTVNVAVLPEWHGIRQVVIEALHPYPEARLAVVRALKGE